MNSVNQENYENNKLKYIYTHLKLSINKIYNNNNNEHNISPCRCANMPYNPFLVNSIIIT